jgi:hypothetical protein
MSKTFGESGLNVFIHGRLNIIRYTDKLDFT